MDTPNKESSHGTPDVVDDAVPTADMNQDTSAGERQHPGSSTFASSVPQAESMTSNSSEDHTERPASPAQTGDDTMLSADEVLNTLKDQLHDLLSSSLTGYELSAQEPSEREIQDPELMNQKEGDSDLDEKYIDAQRQASSSLNLEEPRASVVAGSFPKAMGTEKLSVTREEVGTDAEPHSSSQDLGAIDRPGPIESTTAIPMVLSAATPEDGLHLLALPKDVPWSVEDGASTVVGSVTVLAMAEHDEPSPTPTQTAPPMNTPIGQSDLTVSDAHSLDVSTDPKNDDVAAQSGALSSTNTGENLVAQQTQRGSQESVPGDVGQASLGRIVDIQPSISPRALSPLQVPNLSSKTGLGELPLPSTMGNPHNSKSGAVTLYENRLLDLDNALQSYRNNAGKDLESFNSIQAMGKAVRAIANAFEITVAEEFSAANRHSESCLPNCPFERLASKIRADAKMILHQFEEVSEVLLTETCRLQTPGFLHDPFAFDPQAIPEMSPQDEELMERIQSDLRRSRTPSDRKSTASYSDDAVQASEDSRSRKARGFKAISQPYSDSDSAGSTQPDSPASKASESAPGLAPPDVGSGSEEDESMRMAGSSGWISGQQDENWTKPTWTNPSWAPNDELEEHADFPLPSSHKSSPRTTSNAGTQKPSQPSTRRHSATSLAGELNRLRQQPWPFFEEADHDPATGTSWYNSEGDTLYKIRKGVVWQGRRIDAPEFQTPDWNNRESHPLDNSGYLYDEKEEAWYKEDKHGWFEIRKAPSDVEMPETWGAKMQEHEASRAAWLAGVLRYLSIATRWPWIAFRYFDGLIDKSAFLQAGIRAARLAMLLHNIQTYVANKRERHTWLEANDLTRVHMLRFMRREPFMLTPGVDYSHAISWLDITTATLFLLHVCNTCSGAVLTAASRIQESTTMWCELVNVACQSAWADTACFSITVLWRLLSYWVKDALTLPFQFWGYVSHENEVLIEQIYEIAAYLVGVVIGWSYYLEQPAWGLFRGGEVDVGGWLEFLYSVTIWPWNLWNSWT